MLFTIYGNNYECVREKKEELLGVLLGRHPNAEVVRIHPEEASKEGLSEAFSARGLFADTLIVVCDGFSLRADTRDILCAALPEAADSENNIIVVDGEVDAATKKLFKKYAKEITECDTKKEKTNGEFSIFALTDVFGAREKKGMWVALEKAYRAGIVAEEIHGMLFWQTKNMLMAKEAKEPAKTGLNPFVFKKAQAYSKNFSKEELEEFLSSLVGVYHDSRRGKGELPEALEALLLRAL